MIFMGDYQNGTMSFKIKTLLVTAGHTQLPCSAVAIVGSFAYLVCNPTRKRFELATAYTGGRCMQI